MRKIGFTIGLLVFCLSFVACTTDEVLSSIDIALQAAGAIDTEVGVLSPGAAVVFTAITNDAQTGLNAVDGFYEDYEASCKSGGGCSASDWQKAEAAAAALQTTETADIAALPSDVSQAARTKITAFVDLVLDVANVVFAIKNAQTPQQSLLDPRSGDSGNGGGLSFAMVATIQNASAKSLKKKWDEEVCGGSKSCRNKVKLHKFKKEKGQKKA